MQKIVKMRKQGIKQKKGETLDESGKKPLPSHPIYCASKGQVVSE